MSSTDFRNDLRQARGGDRAALNRLLSRNQERFERKASARSLDKTPLKEKPHYPIKAVRLS